MKYKTIIETNNIKGFKFFEDSNGKYIIGKDAGVKNDEWIALYFTEYEQKPQTGHWIIDSWLWNCSNCGEYYHKDNARKYHFCPNCGIRMVGDDNENSD